MGQKLAVSKSRSTSLRKFFKEHGINSPIQVREQKPIAIVSVATTEVIIPILFEPSPLLGPSQFDVCSFSINYDDSITRVAWDAAMLILSELSSTDLCRIQQVSKAWYTIAANNKLWKDIVARESKTWVGGDKLVPVFSNWEQIQWKQICRDYKRIRLCNVCHKKFRKTENNSNQCQSHSGRRDIIHHGVGPSGVKYSCCFAFDKNAPGCTFKCHEEKD